MHVAFVNVPAHGHVNPTIGVVAELVRRGIRVTYHCGEPHRQAVAAAGAEFHPYEPGAIDNDMPHDGDVLGLVRVVREASSRIAPRLLPLLRVDRPDVVVHDSLAPWGKEVARALGIPAVCSITTFVFDHRVALSRPELLARFVRGHLRRASNVRYLTGALDAISNREPTNLVYTSRAFQPFGDRFDHRFVFVGAIPRDEPALDAEVARLDRVIYVTLGTLFNDRPELFRAAIDGLADLGRPLVVSTGGRLDPAHLGRLPQGIVARRWVPQLALLRRASLVVTHGGMNTVNEALLHGVPLVVVPQAADQSWVARRVADVGAGVSVHDATAEVLRRAARRVLDDPAMRAAAGRIGATLREAGGAGRAADAISASMGSGSRARRSARSATPGRADERPGEPRAPRTPPAPTPVSSARDRE